MRLNLLVVMIVLALVSPVWADAKKDVISGEDALDRGKYDLAIRYFTRAIQSKELSVIYLAMSFTNRGNAYSGKGLYDQAIKDYGQTIRLVPRYSKAFYNRGLVYKRKGFFDRAIKDYDQAIKLEADFAEAYEDRGIAFSKKGLYGRSIRDFDKAILLKPKSAKAFYNRGTTYGQHGKYDRAIQDFDQVLRLQPDHALALYNRGNIFAQKGVHDRAFTDLDQAVRLNPKIKNAFRSRGRVRFYQGKFKAALPDFVTAVRLNPKNTYAILWLYLGQERAGKRGKSLLAENASRLDLTQWPGQVVDFYLGRTTADDLKASIDGPDSRERREKECEYFFYVGEYYLLRGEKKAAAKMFRRALDTGITDFIEYTTAKVELERFNY